jgi:hypothetical protein
MNLRLLRWGVAEEVCHDAQNPGMFSQIPINSFAAAAAIHRQHVG